MSYKNFYKIKEVCNITGLTRATLYTLVRNGKLPFIKVGKQYLIPVEFFEESVISNNIISTSPTATKKI